MNNRHYDPAIGRFISPDPLYNTARPQTINPYAYGLNNPVTHADPSGLYIPENAVGNDPVPAENLPPRTSPGQGGGAGGSAGSSGGGGSGVGGGGQNAGDGSSGGGSRPLPLPMRMLGKILPDFGLGSGDGNWIGSFFRSAAFDYRECDDIWSASCGLQILGLFPSGKLGKLGKLGDLLKGAENADDIVRATRAARRPQILKVGDVKLPGVPKGATGTLTDNGKGLEYAISPGTPEISERVVSVRIMDPVIRGPHRYPDGYAVYMNKAGQTVDPLSGRVIHFSHPYAHIPLP